MFQCTFLVLPACSCVSFNLFPLCFLTATSSQPCHSQRLQLRQLKRRTQRFVSSTSYEVGGGYPEEELDVEDRNGRPQQRGNQQLDSSQRDALLKGGEQVISVLQEMITLLEDTNMDEASEKVAVELAAQGVIGKRVDEMESNFMMALDYMIQLAENDQDDKRKTLLEVIKETVLSHLTKKCPPHVQVIGLLCRTPQKESRYELLRRVAAGGGVFKGENDTKIHIPKANLNDIANQADDLLETMETRPVVPDRKLLARLVLIREEARDMMGGGILDERNNRGLYTLPQSEFMSMRRESGKLTIGDLASKMSRLKVVGENLSEEERASFIHDLYQNTEEDVDFELFLKVYLKLQTFASSRTGNSAKNPSAFLKAATTNLLHTISESEKASYVAHINNYLAEDGFLKKYLPIDPSTNDLFEIAKDGVLLCKLINVAVPGTIDERAINTKRILNPWERNENHTLCLNSAKAIGCTVVNIGTQDFIEGRRHLVLGLISQIIKIQLLADLNLRKTPQLVELIGDSKDMEELMSLPPEKILLRWMNYHLKKSGYKKIVSNFSSDVKDAEAYAHLLNVLAPEYINPATLEVKNPFERAKLVLEHADKMCCKRYLTARDIVEGSPNLNLAFVAHIFQLRNGLSTQTRQASFLETLPDDTQDSREERAFRLWINSLGNSTYINNVFEDVRNGWVLLETLEKVSPGIVNWKIANKPPIKMPFKKVENCNQVVKIGKQLRFSLVNVAGNDIVQGNKKLILAYLWQLMRYNILQLLKNLRSHSHGKEITDADILEWANNKVISSGSQSRMDSFKDKSLSDGIFFLDLLSSVQPRAVNWGLITKGVTDEEKKMNASYIISIARKLGCSIFLLPEDITEVNQKMILTLTASIMYWFLKHPHEDQGKAATSDSESGSQMETVSNSTSDDSASDSSLEDNPNM